MKTEIQWIKFVGGPTAMVTLLFDPKRRLIGVKHPVSKDKHFF